MKNGMPDAEFKATLRLAALTTRPRAILSPIVYYESVIARAGRKMDVSIEDEEEE